MPPAEPARQAHAVLDLKSRHAKALKIERLLKLEPGDQPLRLLEIGTGSGGIAHYFATHPTLRCEVTAVDVKDNRLVHDGYDFHLVADVELPFPAASFDVVISNHVIEHVGDDKAQARHLAEIHRVMRPQGMGYLAVPNRWMLIEPHYRLMFLSWLPHAWRTPYLHLMRKGRFYDCEPLEMRQLEHMLESADLAYRNICVEALRETLTIEKPHSIVSYLLFTTPDILISSMHRFIPTLIYSFSRKQ